MPSGKRWASDFSGWLRIPIRTVASQIGAARPRLMDSWVVGVKVYGSKPSTFSETRKSISEVNKAAHLWPSSLRGVRIW